MMLPQSAQLGESALTLKATRVVAPREATIGLVLAVPLPMPFAWPLACPFESTGRTAPLPPDGAVPTAVGRSPPSPSEEDGGGGGEATEEEVNAPETPAAGVSDDVVDE